MSVRIIVAPEYSHLRGIVEKIAREGLPADAEVIYRARNVVAVVHSQGVALNVKAFKVPILINKIAYGMLRKSKARRSYEYAQRLLAMGIPTPSPVAYIEEHRRGLLYRSYYICLQAGDFDTIRHIDQRPDYADYARELAVLIKQLRDRSVLMLDFTPGNVLRRHRDGRTDFRLIDLNRMKFGVKSEKKLDRMFGAIVDHEDAVALLGREYARLTGLPEAEGEARALEGRRFFLKKIEKRQKIKKLLKIFSCRTK